VREQLMQPSGPHLIASHGYEEISMALSQLDVYRWTADVLSALRTTLDALEFVEILPAVLSERYEPGARHAVAVLGDRGLSPIVNGRTRDGKSEVSVSGSAYYYLPVSHCVEKQLALEHLQRAYCIAPCIRLMMDGEEHSKRHLCTFFQAVIEWRTESEEEAHSVIEALLSRFSDNLRKRLTATARLTNESEARLASLGAVPYERIPFAQARQRVAGVGGRKNPHADGDLTHEEENVLSLSAARPFWITNYPPGARDSLYRRNGRGGLATYDLILPFGYGEVATGGLRPDSANEILCQAGTFTSTPHTYYARWKERTRVQTGGIGFGLERLVRYCAGAHSILELRASHDQGPNSRIGQSMAQGMEAHD
jgi:asparaginyl-tRNA synthetase